MDAEVAEEIAEVVAITQRPWWHTALRVLGLVIIAAVVVALVQGNLPSPAEIWAALKNANGWWVAASALLQIFSIGMFARQQRRLLGAFGVPMSYARAGAITYSSSAITNSVPAGAAVSAGWSYKQYRARGASSATAATVMLLSGLLSIVALVLLYLVGLLAAAWTQLSHLAEDHPAGAVAVGLALLGTVVVAIRFVADRKRQLSDVDAPTPKLDHYEVKHAKLGAAARQVLTTLRQAKQVRWRDWNLAMSTSTAKWLLDAASLYAACRAVDIDINLLKVGALYLGIQLVRQVPLTPGGIGVIEAALMAGLISAGAPQASAAAAVVIYRLFSAWLIIPIGYATMAVLVRWDKTHPRVKPATESAEPDRPADPAPSSPHSSTNPG